MNRRIPTLERERLIIRELTLEDLDTFNQVLAFNRAPNAPATAEVGLFWAIDPAHQKNGYAPEAAHAEPQPESPPWLVV